MKSPINSGEKFKLVEYYVLIEDFVLLIWCCLCLHVVLESAWNYIHLSCRWSPKLTPTANGVSFESAQQAVYIPDTLQNQILIFKAVSKSFSFYQKQDWKNYEETHVQNPTIKFQKWWMTVERKTVKT